MAWREWRFGLEASFFLEPKVSQKLRTFWHRECVFSAHVNNLLAFRTTLSGAVCVLLMLARGAYSRAVSENIKEKCSRPRSLSAWGRKRSLSHTLTSLSCARYTHRNICSSEAHIERFSCVFVRAASSKVRRVLQRKKRNDKWCLVARHMRDARRERLARAPERERRK